MKYQLISTYHASALGLAAAAVAGGGRLARAENAACLTLEDCKTKSQEMGVKSINFYSNNFPTKGVYLLGYILHMNYFVQKYIYHTAISFISYVFVSSGCFIKNNKAFWSPSDSMEKMSTSDLPGIQKRVWCESKVFEKSSAEGVACATEDDCKTKSLDLGIASIYFYSSGDFRTPTKGCFMKNNKAFWSLGSEEEMSATDLPPAQERIWCDDIELPEETAPPTSASPTSASPTSASPTTAAPTSVSPTSASPTSKNPTGEEEILPVEDDIACLTEKDCKEKSQELGVATFYSGVYPTKGCFTKNNISYFSLGPIDKMSKAKLPGEQKRLWCNASTQDQGGNEAESSSSVPTSKPTVTPTLRPSKKPTKVPTKKPTKVSFVLC